MNINVHFDHLLIGLHPSRFGLLPANYNPKMQGIFTTTTEPMDISG